MFLDVEEEFEAIVAGRRVLGRVFRMCFNGGWDEESTSKDALKSLLFVIA